MKTAEELFDEWLEGEEIDPISTSQAEYDRFCDMTGFNSDEDE